ncbi:UPF0481 protein At3g47200-like [Prosopis cineraria]|uniref:UPF0481 protein At3g47200-like n=1 Tax=Prosopis cineraria TaxID=364024 RepID=UPI00240FDCD4|nr:UPF0481 protein At3g47200-like [Prosopis cineraria]XP_054815904.1 UPF0481 protein At3g47200-like [Prosopis cineraria]XP_054815905.1 UPF0481 protein At3g47200-like [Prosopis cineraria]XP_054815907.1 UPF0481 protein At3g47200-like [Prosopis cineraria]XP_054815908.1 UPF0481 protein At3g47200-like [Prosopis cineraria]XP_054815909.1 UPF0481 protein At3g47200-like [Prosopis cineraria]XP_054815910.1 UPF0481 protein At3g47200-like [Prosopis cineraria]
MEDMKKTGLKKKDLTSAQMEDDVMIDIETLIRDSGDGLLSPDWCISSVCHTMRDLRPDAYTPKFVSIGPFHYRTNKRLRDMERHKQVFFKRFTQRTKTSLNDLVSFVKRSVPKVRACYSENINFGDMELVKLILVDAAFIIEFLYRFYKREDMLNDAKLSQLPLLETIPLDLVLLENQLPFFVLEELFNIAFPLGLRGNLPSFLELAYELFCPMFDLEKPKHDPHERIKHFTDLVRFLFGQREPPTLKPFSSTTEVLLYTAKELQEFGVKFKASKSKSILDIKFSRGVLELPCFVVKDLVTKALFLNMVAFEQLHCPRASYITNYISEWNCLIITKEDVNVLVDENIIHSFKPDTEVVALFRIMQKNSFQSVMISEYIDLFKRLNGFCKNPLRQNKATLKHDYCRTPWQIVASIAGIILLVLTIVQTIFSIFK